MSVQGATFPKGSSHAASYQWAPYPTGTVLNLLPHNCQLLPALAGIGAFHPSELQ